MKNRFFAVITAAVLSVSAFSTPFQTYIGASVTAEAASTVAVPKSSRASGKYYSDGNLKVRLSCATQDATIYYSINDGSYKRYTKAIYITKNSTLKFYAKKSGVTSKTVTRTYKLLPKFNITPSEGSYDGQQTIKLSSSVSGLKFYYTLDGSTPTTNSALYTAKGITIDEDCTLRIRTSKSGWNSRTVTKRYTIGSAYSSDDEPVITTREGSILEDYTSKYCYSALDQKQKKLYRMLYEGVSEHKEKIQITELDCNATDVEKAFYAMDYDNPQFFWLSSGYTFSYIGNTVHYVQPAYSRTAKQAAALQPKIEAAAEKIVNIALEKDSLFERVLYIHDVVVNRTAYTLTGGEHIRDIDGVLINGKALCEGYAKTFAYLCQLVGIETFCVIGDADGPHMWNMVKLGGDWYHMDTTFDDPISDFPMRRYTYFCVTDKQIGKTHVTDQQFAVPKAKEDDYNYYKVMNITVYDDVQSAYKMLLLQAAANYTKDIKYTEIVCTEDCCTQLYDLMYEKDSDIYKDLELYGCKARGMTFGYSGDRFYIQLK